MGQYYTPVQGEKLNRSQQKGIALITALLIVTLATIAAVTITAELQREVRRSGNILHHDQAYLYAVAAEDFARYGLKLDFDDNKTDHLHELWHVLPVTEDIEGGTLEGKLSERQGLFNLNSLANGNAINLARFQRLLTNLDVTPLESQQITDALIDWMDNDQISRPSYGAEDDFYQGLAEPQKPHLAANHLLTDLSELRIIKGFNEKVLSQLRITPEIDPKTGEKLPAVFTVLPEVDTPININTASIEVLKSLDIKITDAVAESIVNKRDGTALTNGSATPFKTANEFKNYLTSLSISNVDMTSLSVVSEYFVIKSTIVVGQSNIRLSSLLKRDTKGLSRIISRNQGGR